MTKVFLNNNQDVIKFYPNHIPYKKNKTHIIENRKYEKVGTDQISHGRSWRLKYLVLSVTLSVFLIPLAIYSYRKFVGKLWDKGTTGTEKLSIYKEISNEILKINPAEKTNSLNETKLANPKIQRLENEIKEFDQDTQLQNALQEVENFIKTHENDLPVDLESLDEEALKLLEEKIKTSKDELEEKIIAASLQFPEMSSLYDKYPNLMNPVDLEITPDHQTILENLNVRSERLRNLIEKSKNKMSQYFSFSLEIGKKIFNNNCEKINARLDEQNARLNENDAILAGLRQDIFSAAQLEMSPQTEESFNAIIHT